MRMPDCWCATRSAACTSTRNPASRRNPPTATPRSGATLRPSAEGASAHHQRGLELLNEGKPGPALRELELALGQDSGNHEIMKGLGNAHRAMGELERAIHFY